MSELPVLSSQKRLAVTLLDSYPVLYGRAQWSLFGQVQAGVRVKKLKRSFLTHLELTARKFHVLRVCAPREDHFDQPTAARAH
ncbi:hypothetical protein [Candidatus Methylacidithermus pantelleriae]|uniref:Uncharacterized protein n=1 Tax=Candidatus Methylacidithermus pantelleriae TaxID=2744239 RepID=A0A8J2BKB2_9BACT|nr:hypothetical protein [Candidatus Methylacidithermus pantelleriae]CAF0699809.1 hypothetical protein MPNT_300004 [Candidatus Methylacidithermus pantelleriae]